MVVDVRGAVMVVMGAEEEVSRRCWIGDLRI